MKFRLVLAALVVNALKVNSAFADTTDDVKNFLKEFGEGISIVADEAFGVPKLERNPSPGVRSPESCPFQKGETDRKYKSPDKTLVGYFTNSTGGSLVFEETVEQENTEGMIFEDERGVELAAVVKFTRVSESRITKKFSTKVNVSVQPNQTVLLYKFLVGERTEITTTCKGKSPKKGYLFIPMGIGVELAKETSK